MGVFSHLICFWMLFGYTPTNKKGIYPKWVTQLICDLGLSHQQRYLTTRKKVFDQHKWVWRWSSWVINIGNGSGAFKPTWNSWSVETIIQDKMVQHKIWTCRMEKATFCLPGQETAPATPCATYTLVQETLSPSRTPSRYMYHICIYIYVVSYIDSMCICIHRL